eukprot:TRINITY_DN13014_c0_g1_i2.p1 TRINITY_DN13014_c0_g1~~TRINITY_DN13014_c0_g1_i2.p1  ORF type:complete len:118 (-),score=3.84 TRINITY_DN13014_c0_g1_i2:1048-1401(-)
MIIKIQFGAMCYRWIVVIYFWEDNGCMIRMKLMACVTIHTHFLWWKASVTKEALQVHPVYTLQRQCEEDPSSRSSSFFKLGEMMQSKGSLQEGCGPCEGPPKQFKSFYFPNYLLLDF